MSNFLVIFSYVRNSAAKMPVSCWVDHRQNKQKQHWNLGKQKNETGKMLNKEYCKKCIFIFQMLNTAQNIVAEDSVV